MLPSCGYFKNIACPFFASGLCERPHCHFRHQKLEVLNRPSPQNVSPNILSSTNTDSNKLIQMYDEAIRKIQEEVASCESKSRLVKETTTVPSHIRAVPVPMYIPTPVSRTKVQPTRKEPVSQFPAYTPTPIAQLKRLRSSVTESDEPYDPTEDIAFPEMKKKRVEEYDPTKVTPVSLTIKSVNLGDEEYTPGSLSTNGGVAKLSDDSEDDVGGAAFSDGDSDTEFNKNEKEVEQKNKTESETTSKNDGPIEKCDVVTLILQASQKSNNLIKNWTEKNATHNEEETEVKSKAKTKTKVSSKISSDKSQGKTKIETKVSDGTEKSVEKRNAKEDLQTDTKSKNSTMDSNRDDNEKSEGRKLCSTKSHSSKQNVEEKDKSEVTGTSSESSKKLSSQKHDKDKKKKLVTKPEHSEKEVSDKKHGKKDSTDKTESKTKKTSHKGHSDKKGSSNKEDSKAKNKEKASDEPKKTKDNKSSSIKKHKSSKNDQHSEKSSSKSKTEKHDKNRVSSSKKHKKESSKKSKENHESTRVNGKSSKESQKEEHKKKDDLSNVDLKLGHRLKSSDDTSDSDCSSLKKTNRPQNSLLSDISKTSNMLAHGSSHFRMNLVKSGEMLSQMEEESHFSESDMALIADDMDLDDHDTYEECWRIFNEAPATNSDESNNQKMHKFEDLTKNDEFSLIPNKKRIAHQPDLQRNTDQQLPTYCGLSPAQAMHNRFILLQQRYSQEQAKRPSFVSKHSPEKAAKRIAHVPNAALISAVARQRSTSYKENSQAPQEITLVTTVAKGARRIAHVPILVKNARPTIPSEYGSKVPSIIRQRYLNLFIDECLKFCSDEESAYERGLKEEKNSYDRSTNKTVYLNVAVNSLKRLRDEAEKGPVEIQQPQIPLRVPVPPKQPVSAKKAKVPAPVIKQKIPVSHEAVLGGAKAARTSFSIERKTVKPSLDATLRGEKLYLLLKPYILTEEQLEEYGFPRVNPDEPGKASFMKVEKKKGKSNDPNQRVCCRCQTNYRVDDKGIPLKIEECTYHWGRLWNKRVERSSFERRYNCCQGDGESDGCCIGKSHVHEEDYDNLRGFTKTLPKPASLQDGSCGIFSLDCEMCYTTQGIELTRVTVIGDDLKPVYEALVKPEGPVIDYNTRFSGITEDDLTGVRTTIRDVQAVLLSLFNEKTILMGHSLESDFRALRLIHSTVVDTSIVFPHKMGLPFKRALKTLMAEYLNKIIQNSVEGHDSQEDALACLQLMLWKVKEDIKIGR